MALITLIGIAIVFLLMWVAVRGRESQLRDWSDIKQRTVAVDVEALAALFDAADVEFLRSRLSGRSFRRVQRRRILAVLSYITTLAHNAAVLIRAAELGRQSDDTAVQSAAAELLNAALLLRLQTTVALVSYMCQLPWPVAHGRREDLLQSYSDLRDRFYRVVRVASPSQLAALHACI